MAKDETKECAIRY